MILTENVLNNSIETFLESDLKVGTLTSSSSLFLNGFDDEVFPDTIVCVYCGKPLEGSFGEKGEFNQDCTCDMYKTELKIRKKYSSMVERLELELKDLSEIAIISSKKLIQLNNKEFILKRTGVLKEELNLIECFEKNETN